MEKNKSGIRSFHFQYEHERALKKMHQSQDGMWTANMPTALTVTFLRWRVFMDPIFLSSIQTWTTHVFSRRKK